MDETEKTREQLTQELAQAQKRIAKLEAVLVDSGKTHPVDFRTFKAFFESATDSFSIWDSNLNMIYLNDATLTKYYPPGTKRADVIGKHFIELVPGCVESGRYEKYLNVLNIGKPFYIEEFTPHPKFGAMYLAIKVFKIENGLGIITIDITERKRMEQALQDSQQRLCALIENAPDVIFTYDSNGRFVSGNKKAEELMGYSREELLGKTFTESGIFTEEALAKASERLAENRIGKQTQPIPFELIAKDRSRIFVEVHSVPIVQGEKVEVIAIARDITERKRTEDALRQSEEKLRAIFESIGDSITVIDVNGNITDLNNAALKLFGCQNKEEALGVNSLTFIAEENQPSATDKLNQAKPERFVQYKFKRKDGSIFLGEASSDALRNRSGEITGFIGIVRDITERKKMEETLRQSEGRLSAYFENAPDAIFVYDFDGVFLDGNRKGEEITGYSKDELVGKNFIESGLFSEIYALKAMNAVLKDVRGEATQPEEYEITRKDGQKRFLESTSFVVKDQWKGEVVGIARDITERKKIEEELRQSEEKLRRIFESIGDAITILDMNGIVIDANETAICMSGGNREDYIGRYCLDLLAERDRARALKGVTEALTTGHKGVEEYTVSRKDGTEFPAETKSTVLYDASGKPIGLINILRDITQRKQMEGKLKQSEEKIRQIFDSIGISISVTDMEGKIVEVNDFGLRLCECSKEEMIGHNGIRFIAERDRPRIIKEMIRAFETGKSDIHEFTALKKDGTEYETETISTVMRDSSGKPTGLITSITDITERKRIERELNDYKANLERMVQERTAELANTYEELRRSEEALRKSEEKLRAIFNSITDGISVTDMSGRIVDENEHGAKLMGYARKEEVTGLNGFDFIAEIDRGKVLKELEDSLIRGYGGTNNFRLIDRNGREFDGELTSSILWDSSGQPTGLVCVMRNITERKRMEEALKESETKYRTLVEQSEQGICILQDGRIAFANNALAKINGYSLKEMYAMSPDELLLTFHPDDREAFVERVTRRLQGDKMMSRHEYRAIRKDGTEHHLETYTKRITYNGKPAIQSTIADITERKQWEAKLKESKEELRFYLNQITKAQEEERRKIARELHDDTIQELITLTRQIDDLIDKKIKPDEDRRGSRRKLEAARQKIDTILQGIRRFTQDLRPSVLDDLGLVPALEWLTSDISNRFGIPINISIIGAEQPSTPDAALAIFRIAQESLRNAGQHSKASQIQLNLKYTSKTAILSIIDNGVGFTPPKQTASLTRHGKLGIAGMYERTQLIGATLSIKSKRNKGTTITLEVPIK